MKRLLILVLACFISAGAFAATSVLIDFTEFAADMDSGENSATLIQLADYVDYNLSEAEKQKMFISYAINNWRVSLEPTARNTVRVNKSKAREAVSRGGIDTGADSGPITTEDTTVMGFRALFPDDTNGYYADLIPPAEIPVFFVNESGEYVFQKNKGVIMNVGFIKSVSVTFCGRNYPYQLEILLMDENRQEKVIPMGTVDFLGWKTLKWDNPQYIDVAYNRDTEFGPVYPQPLPYIKLKSVRIKKQAMEPGGNFIGYIKEITVVYDEAIIQTDTSIEDEEVWFIRRDEGSGSTEYELRKLARERVKLFLEEVRMDEGETQADTPAAE
ncbi:MAG: hypothetical protein JXR63_10710 [Spirochaetales bacterium]|nr:hypothetical protein [Spirochaetales bacterium]